MRLLYFTLFFALILFPEASAQKKMSWRKRAKIAAEFEKSGDLYQAAIYYKGVYKEKLDKPEYSFKAGRCFLELRDYKNAATSLEVVKDDYNNSKYDKPGYKYALALKQMGQAEKAKEAFNIFLQNYQGEDKTTYKEFVENEVKGCNYALKAQEYTNPAVNIEHLGPKVNSAKTEFAPIAFANNVLYFSSTSKGVAKIHRTVKQGDSWLRPQVPPIFVGMERTHFGNGSFTEDGKRFFFTQCDIVEGKPQCAIYIMQETGSGKWSRPMILPDYINPEEFNTTHPYVVTDGESEILYFSSNRQGGKGGLDLWYTTRPVGSDKNSFTLPKNLGRNINSLGDEISPFYHKATSTLYFSSNGRVSAGGLDIFKSKGKKLQWEVAQNMGFPVNSSSDDLYYTISEPHGGGYLVSNRPSLPERETTTDDDIFYFGIKNISINITGSITSADQPEKGLMKDINIKLFKRTSIGEEELIDERMLPVGEYEFKKLNPRTSYIAVLYKENFKETSFPFATGDESIDITNDVEMIAINTNTISSEVAEVDPRDIRNYILPPRFNSNEKFYRLPIDPIDPDTGLEYTGDTLNIFNLLDAIAGLGHERGLYVDAHHIPQPHHETIEVDTATLATIVPGPYESSKVMAANISYKIQVSAVRNFRADKYNDLKEIGRLSMEDIDGGIKRILVINKEDNKEGLDGFKRKSDALNALSYILNSTRFEYAFVIKYVAGERVGDGFRGWNEEEGLETDTKPDGVITKGVYEGF
jgi:hypothetical protein